MRAAIIPVAMVPVSQILLQNLDGSTIVHLGVTDLDWKENDHTHTKKLGGTETNIGKGTDSLDQVIEFDNGGVFENDPTVGLLVNLDGSTIVHLGVTDLDWKENDHTYTHKLGGTETKIGKGTDGLDQVIEFDNGGKFENDPTEGLLVNLDGSTILHLGVDDLDWKANDHTYTHKLGGTETRIGKGTDGLDQVIEFDNGGKFEGDPDGLILNLQGNQFLLQRNIGF